MLDPERGPLPIYPNASDMQARIHHKPEKPGPQLKDLAKEEARRR